MINLDVGAIVIGRNEGARLEKCLLSLINQVNSVVYVDSGSIDNSIKLAIALGVEDVHLDLNMPFTAARARNAGAFQLLRKNPNLKYLQFIDGDCELVDGWLSEAHRFMEDTLNIAAVCGRRRERYPETSYYNLVCDIEWDTPVGNAQACGGDVLMRAEAFKIAQGFREDLIAGEEPELCFRLRQLGYGIYRLASEMTLHDAAITQFNQWWKRAMRGGYAFANVAYLHRNSPEKLWFKESARTWFWGLLVPFIVVIFAMLLSPWFWFAILIYPIQVIKIAILGGNQHRARWVSAFFLVLAKFPEVLGQIKFLYNAVMNKRGKLIEYK